MSASEKLKALDEGIATGPLGVKEYSDGSAYVEHADRGWMVVEFRENKTNRLDDMVRLCDIRNALPQIIAVVEAAEKIAGPVKREMTDGEQLLETKHLARVALHALDEALS